MDRLFKTSGALLMVALFIWGAFPLWGGYEAARLAGSAGPFCVALIIASLWWAAAGLVGGLVVVLMRVEAQVVDLHHQLRMLGARVPALVPVDPERPARRATEREARVA